MGCVTGQSAGGALFWRPALTAVSYRDFGFAGNNPGIELRSKLTSAHARKPPIAAQSPGSLIQWACRSLHMYGSSRPQAAVPTSPQSDRFAPSWHKRVRPPSPRAQHFVSFCLTGHHPLGPIKCPVCGEGALVGVVVYVGNPWCIGGEIVGLCVAGGGVVYGVCVVGAAVKIGVLLSGVHTICTPRMPIHVPTKQPPVLLEGSYPRCKGTSKRTARLVLGPCCTPKLSRGTTSPSTRYTLLPIKGPTG